MTAPAPARAIFCCAEDPFTGAWCARIACDGHHSADGTDWTTPTHDDARRTDDAATT